MKHVFLTLTLLATIIVMSAQNAEKSITSGIIEYEQTVKFEIHLEGDASEFADMLPKERKSMNILIFNENVALYENIKKEEDTEMSEMAQEGMIIKIDQPDYTLFTDFDAKKQIEQREFMTRQFLIESDLETKGWKLIGNQKTILGYNCQEAIKEEGEKKVTVWFTSEIPVSAGPAKFIGLPGMVLLADIDDGQMIISATKIESKTIETSSLEKPKKGKNVSQEEFDTIVAEKMKEMGAEGDGKGNHFMIKIDIEK